MSVRIENNYRENGSLHNTSQTKTNRIEEEIAVHKYKLGNICDG